MPRRTAQLGRFLAAATALAAPAASASIFKGEALDKAADVLTWVVIIVVPIVLVAGFWFVHILPEKVAEQREHPQKEVIKVICLLSLFFGGLLWPIAWILAYTKPVIYKMAYGRDKHDDYYAHLAATDGQGRRAAGHGGDPAPRGTGHTGRPRQAARRAAGPARAPGAVESRVVAPPAGEGGA